MTALLEGPPPVLTPNEIELINAEYGVGQIVELKKDDVPSSSLPDLPNKPNKTNWVEKAGGLPSYIKRIAKHLVAKGMSTSRAIASAVNTVKRWSRGGGGVKPDTRAKASGAVADWNRKRGQSRATSALVREVEEYIVSEMPTRFVELSAPPTGHQFKAGNSSGTNRKSGGRSGPPQSVINSNSSRTPDTKGGGGSSAPPWAKSGGNSGGGGSSSGGGGGNVPPQFKAQQGKGGGGSSSGGNSGPPQSVLNSNSAKTPNANTGSSGSSGSGSTPSRPSITDAASCKAAIATAMKGSPSPTLVAYLKQMAKRYGVDASNLSANAGGNGGGTSSMPAFLGKGNRG